jgi:hypothetical protein
MKSIKTILALGVSFSLAACNDGSDDMSSADNQANKSPEEAVKDTAENLFADTRDFMTKMTGTIKEVNEGADLEKATGKLEEWKGEAQSLSERMKVVIEEKYEGSKEAFNQKMEEVSGEEGEMEKMVEEFSAEMKKLGQDGQAEAKELMQELESVLGKFN